MINKYDNDDRIVLTLDAGGTNLKFAAIRRNKLIVGPVSLPTHAENLERCLANIIGGFDQVRNRLPEPPVAISFAFPGPADYSRGLIFNVGNLPAFRGGVALGPILVDHFGVPVFLNNDGDLFAYGEVIAGFLPYVNAQLEQGGNPKRYRNLLGITLGTGLGGGIVRNGELFIGDNSGSGEVWLLRNKLNPGINAEEGASIRAVRRVYAQNAGIAMHQAPEPSTIFDIAMGRTEGNGPAAIQALRAMGEVVGDVVAQALTLLDGLAVIGGGISSAYPVFLPPLLDAMKLPFDDGVPRLVAKPFNFEDQFEREAFLKGEVREIAVAGSGRVIKYDSQPRIAVGISRLGTSEAVTIGAYAFALSHL